MKKLFAVAVSLMVIVCMAACSAEKKENVSMLVCSFSGGDERFSLSNGIVVITEDNEVFSGGDLAVNGDFSDVTASYMQFYVIADGEEHTVLSCGSENQTGEALELNGDTGAVSGKNIFPKSEENTSYEYLDHIWLRLTLCDRNGTQKTYELPMTAKLVFRK